MKPKVPKKLPHVSLRGMFARGPSASKAIASERIVQWLWEMLEGPNAINNKDF